VVVPGYQYHLKNGKLEVVANPNGGDGDGDGDGTVTASNTSVALSEDVSRDTLIVLLMAVGVVALVALLVCTRNCFMANRIASLREESAGKGKGMGVGSADIEHGDSHGHGSIDAKSCLGSSCSSPLATALMNAIARCGCMGRNVCSAGPTQSGAAAAGIPTNRGIGSRDTRLQLSSRSNTNGTATSTESHRLEYQGDMSMAMQGCGLSYTIAMEQLHFCEVIGTGASGCVHSAMYYRWGVT
jgi:hypothetical protein